MFVSPCRIPTVFRHFSPALFAFSVVLSLFYVSSFLSLLSQSFFFFLRHFSIFVSRCRILTAFRQFSPTLFAISVVLCLSYFSSFLLCLSLSFFLLLTSRLYICLLLLFAHCISSILSVLACFLCNSISFLH